MQGSGLPTQSRCADARCSSSKYGNVDLDRIAAINRGTLRLHPVGTGGRESENARGFGAERRVFPWRRYHGGYTGAARRAVGGFPASRFDRLCDHFEAAWEAGLQPSLGDYLVGLATGADERASRNLLIELIKIDMYHRWREAASRSDTDDGSEAATSLSHAEDTARAFPSRPRLRDYALRFSALGPPEELPEDLREYEDRVLAGWGPMRDGVHRDGERAAACGEFAGTERFTVQRRIGAGGMGIVYQAYDRERKEVVALKTLRQLEPTALYYLKREFRSLADISHPNLARLYELFSVAGRWFFTMEFVDGVDFLSFVRCAPRPLGPAGTTSPNEATDLRTWGTAAPDQGTCEGRSEGTVSLADTSAFPSQSQPAAVLSAEQLARLCAALRQLAEGVTALHRAGKLHRDIKPSNVLVTPEGRVVLLDFGLSMELDETTTGQYVVGTAAYMSPEQGVAGPLSPSSDWYSVGVMLYEALTGGLPFQGQSLQVLLRKRETDPPAPAELWAGVPGDLNALCMAVLQRHPAARPSEDEILRRLGDAGVDSTTKEVARRTPFVGREAEIRTLRDSLAAVRRGARNW